MPDELDTTLNIPGIMNKRDRRWRITNNDFEGYITDYNWDITGATSNITELGIRYSDSAWYWTKELAQRGYLVENLGCAR